VLNFGGESGVLSCATFMKEILRCKSVLTTYIIQSADTAVLKFAKIISYIASFNAKFLAEGICYRAMVDPKHKDFYAEHFFRDFSI
jgi:hypothetical protein